MITLFSFECWSGTCWKLLIIIVFPERNTGLVMCDAWDALWCGSQNNWDYVIYNVCTCHDVWTWNADVIIWVRENKSLTAVWRVWEMVSLTAVKNHSSSNSVGDGEKRWLAGDLPPFGWWIFCRKRPCMRITLRGITLLERRYYVGRSADLEK